MVLTAVPIELTTTARLQALLVAGGDERIALDPGTRLNRYGCPAAPDSGEAAFGSSTASVISPRAFAAAQARMEALSAFADPRDAYAWGASDLRARLANLLGLRGGLADGIVLGASGTDLHLIAADLARGQALAPLVTVMADPAETGRGVPEALRSRSYAIRSPNGGADGAGRLLPGAVEGAILTVPLRDPEGKPRPAEDIDADFERGLRRASRTGGPMLLAGVDVTKTGMIAPSAACAKAAKARYGDQLTVLIDACQFRLSADSLLEYLESGFLVAVTGSKFLGGPAFSGALFLPEAGAMRAHPPLPSLADYSGRHDWPPGFAAHKLMPDIPNLGLLLRWEAALHEFSAFRGLCPKAVAKTLTELADTIRAALAAASPSLEPFPAPRLQRPVLDRWDAVPTIFPFGLRNGDASCLQALHRTLAGRVRLGQPVTLGARNGNPLTALRVCVSAGHVVEALGSAAARRAVLSRAETAVAACDAASA